MAITERYFDPAHGGTNSGTEANPWTSWATMIGAVVAGDRVNAKKQGSPYTPGAFLTWATSSTDLLLSSFRGYGSTIADGVKFEFDMGSAYQLTISGEGVLFQNISVTGSHTTAPFVMYGDTSRVLNCRFINTGVSANTHGAADITDGSAINCYFETNGTASTTRCVYLQRGTVENSIFASTRKGLLLNAASRSHSILTCEFYAIGASATRGIDCGDIASTSGLNIKRLTVEGFASSIYFAGMNSITATASVTITDAILANGVTGIENVDNATLTMGPIMTSIAFFNLSGDDTQFGDNEVINPIALTVDPFTDAATNDYSLNNTAGGGADCRGAGIFGGA